MLFHRCQDAGIALQTLTVVIVYVFFRHLNEALTVSKPSRRTRPIRGTAEQEALIFFNNILFSVYKTIDIFATVCYSRAYYYLKGSVNRT